MAENKKSFIIYCDLIDTIDHLTTLEKGKLFEHLLDYVNDKNPIMEDRVLLGTWKHIEQSLKRDLVKYAKIKEKRSLAGKKSAEKRAKKKMEQTLTNPTSVKSVQQTLTNPTSVKSVQQTLTNPTVSVTDTVTDTDTVSNKKKKKEKKVFNFRKSLIESGVSEKIADAWMIVRKKQKAVNTEISLNAIIKEIKKLDITATEAVQIAVEKSWRGLEAEWIKNTSQYKQMKKKNKISNWQGNAYQEHINEYNG